MRYLIGLGLLFCVNVWSGEEWQVLQNECTQYRHLVNAYNQLDYTHRSKDISDYLREQGKALEARAECIDVKIEKTPPTSSLSALEEELAALEDERFYMQKHIESVMNEQRALFDLAHRLPEQLPQIQQFLSYVEINLLVLRLENFILNKKVASTQHSIGIRKAHEFEKQLKNGKAS